MSHHSPSPITSLIQIYYHCLTVHFSLSSPHLNTLIVAIPVTESILTLSLNCLVLGDEPEKMFTVKISKMENVSILRKLIKEKAPHLDHVTASDLQLWKLDLHLVGLGAEPVHVNLNT